MINAFWSFLGPIALTIGIKVHPLRSSKEDSGRVPK